MQIKQTVESGCYVWTKEEEGGSWTPSWADRGSIRAGRIVDFQEAIDDLLDEITALRFSPKR